MATINQTSTHPKLMAGTPADRIAGLEALLQVTRGATVLDCGCHMGYVAHEFAKAGARSIHAFDRYEPGVVATRALLDEFPIEKKVEVLDLVNPAPGSMEPLPRYDIVLYLGMHHKMLQQDRQRAVKILSEMVGRAEKYFAIRTPSTKYPGAERIITDAGFTLWSSTPPHEDVGELRIYRKA
jgi:2-polyprenyl-3-methyl-5-hydroxy-6-metoxy-1,4-benzoquinol methylase